MSRTAIKKYKQEYFYTLMDVVTVSLTDRFELLKSHIDLWKFSYDLSIAWIYAITLKMDLNLILTVLNYAQKFRISSNC